MNSQDHTRFMRQVHIKVSTKIDHCWEWLGHKNKQNIKPRTYAYGRFFWNGINHLAHRVSWEMYNFSSPKGHLVCHRCDNPGCVNPGHLFIGSQSDNMKDMVKKGRHVNASSQKTICPKGHSYDGDNLKIKSDGSRSCILCVRSFERIRSVKRRAENPYKPKTDCKRGHLLAGDNVIMASNGKRMCRLCLNTMAVTLNNKRWNKI